MKKVVILTATRAEYGLLRKVILKLKEEKDIETKILVTGMHLSNSYGYTYEEIVQDGLSADEKIPILQDDDSSEAVNTAMGLAMIQFGHYFNKEKPDLLVVVGDRYETLAVCISAMNTNIPIAHLYGGETTEGAIDEAIRHSITKMSHIHFTSTDEYRKRVIQMGENPESVFNVGAIGVENVMQEKLIESSELGKEIGLDLTKQYAIVTFHPVTLDGDAAEHQFNELLKALDQFELNYLFTKSNADAGGRRINSLMDKYVKEHENAVAVASLGTTRYLSAVRDSCFVIGNSSSGIVEVPSFCVPTINIGDRQKGRVRAESVINCEPIYSQICSAIEMALSNDFREKIKEIKNPYYSNGTSDQIVRIIKDKLEKEEINIKKTFYNIEIN